MVDIETLKHTNEQVISTLDEVARIQKEWRRPAQGSGKSGRARLRGGSEAEADGTRRINIISESHRPSSAGGASRPARQRVKRFAQRKPAAGEFISADDVK